MATTPESYSFENSPHCSGHGAAYGEGDTSYGHDIISIHYGAYPPEGQWARNEHATEDVVVISGRGRAAVRGTAYQLLDADAPAEAQQRTASIPAGEWFRWEVAPDEEMVMSMLTRPAFSKELYKIWTEAEVAQHEALLTTAYEFLDEDDTEYLQTIADFSEYLAYIYSRLIDKDQDPDEILQANGVLERSDNNEF